MLQAETVGAGGRRLGSLFIDLEARARKELALADGITVVSDFLLGEADWLGVSRSRVTVIRNGVPGFQLPGNPGHDPPAGVMVASFRPVKGHSLLLDALSLMRHPPRMRLCGDGADRDFIRKRAADMGLGAIVEFVDVPADVPAELARAQFAVVPSQAEGLSLAALEARAAGLPVIATRVGGLPEVVTDEVNGLLVPPQDPAALAQAIGRIAGDAHLRQRLGAAARVLPEEFTISYCAQRHLDAYGAAIEARRDQGGVH
jgi:glycosyltransferase involved in cell wall biosynthesis